MLENGAMKTRFIVAALILGLTPAAMADHLPTYYNCKEISWVSSTKLETALYTIYVSRNDGPVIKLPVSALVGNRMSCGEMPFILGGKFTVWMTATNINGDESEPSHQWSFYHSPPKSLAGPEKPAVDRWPAEMSTPDAPQRICVSYMDGPKETRECFTGTPNQ